jgi:hypothetical protein
MCFLLLPFFVENIGSREMHMSFEMWGGEMKMEMRICIVAEGGKPDLGESGRGKG